ncbi:MAG: thioredoxin family protein [Promethearchaeota archaeon]
MIETKDDDLERIKHEKMKKLLKGQQKQTDMPAEPIHIKTVDHFKEILEKYDDIPIIADFWAEWCSPCRMLGPIFHQAAEHYKGKVLFIKINTETLPGLAQYFRVSSIPLVLMIHKKEVRASWIGLRPFEFYQKEIDDYLKKQE